MEALLLLVAEVTVRPQHQLQETREVLLGKQVRDPTYAGAFIVGDLKQMRIGAAYFGY